MSYQHKTVLLREVVEYLAPKPGGVYLDATFGGGGHTRALLTQEPNCRVIACDWDKNAIELNSAQVQEEFPGRIEFIWGNFAQLPLLMKKNDVKRVDGVLVDFGTSQFQIATAPGFSFSVDLPLDMRMSPAHYTVTAASIVNQASEQELAEIFWRYGEERQSRRIAHAIVEFRMQKRIKTTGDLVAAITSVLHVKRGMIHPATRVFQALRIAVNHELENIETFLKHLPLVLVPGGRVVCISFHSLEDRLVKHYFREHKEQFEELTRRIVIASPEELAANPSSRSAKLRAAKLR
ncbi:MAG: Ribosomal RNA small subunit methyltransferase H [candidate division TM6 bacterium GW2011_GWE2_42_60]|nr:MAG: Ribosomal RNA small subunit methyltransferase H [candidate division TM6 bacterium GW2011_GWE2_42_60]